MSKKFHWRVHVALNQKTFTNKEAAYDYARPFAAQGFQVSVYHYNRNALRWELHERLKRARVVGVK